MGAVTVYAMVIPTRFAYWANPQKKTSVPSGETKIQTNITTIKIHKFDIDEDELHDFTWIFFIRYNIRRKY